MSVSFVFAPGTANEQTVGEDKISSWDATKTHTGKADLRATFVDDGALNLDGYAQRQDRLNVEIDNSTKWTGYVTGITHDERGATARLRGVGIAKVLEEDRPNSTPVQYTSIALDDAIQDYWSRTPFSNYTVHSQPTQTVTSNADLQDADTTTEWNNIVSIGANTPAYVDGSGNLQAAQVCFTQEGETDVTGTTISGSAYSGGSAQYIDSLGQTLSWDITPQYDIPPDALKVQIRTDDGGEGGLTDGLCEFEWRFNGTVIETNTSVGVDTTLAWNEIAEGFAFDSDSPYSNPTLNAGQTYTLEVEVTNGGASSDGLAVDVVAPFDDNYESDLTFDDTVDANGYLSGPELYPLGVQVETVDKTVAYNIASGTLASTWNDTSNLQQIDLSNDGGASYPLSGSNTTSVFGTFPNNGRTAKVRFTLSRYGSRTTATPTTGFNGQSIDSFDFNGDLDDTVVIDDLELSRDHFSNLQTLHDYGDYLFVIQHDSSDISNLVVESFDRGDQTKAKPSGFDLKENQQTEVAAETYYNSVYIEGALSGGTRPSATQSDSTAISNDDREIKLIGRDPDITTSAGAQFRANSLLDKALEKDAIRGNVSTAALDFVHPGYAYPTDLDNDGVDENFTAESVSISYSTNSVPMANYEFVPPTDISQEVRELKRNLRGVGDQV